MPQQVLAEATAAWESVFLRVSGAAVFGEEHLLEANTLRGLVERMGVLAAAQIEYEKLASAYNAAYFLKNLYKCLLAFSSLRAKNTALSESIVDVGGGAGTATIAWDSVFGVSSNRSATLVDTSSLQLQIGKDLISQAEVGGVEFCQADFWDLAEENQADLRVCSYWLCSQVGLLSGSRDRFAVRKLARHLIGPGALVIDYPDVIECFADISGITPAASMRVAGLPLPIEDVEILSDNQINLSWALFRDPARGSL